MAVCAGAAFADNNPQINQPQLTFWEHAWKVIKFVFTKHPGLTPVKPVIENGEEVYITQVGSNFYHFPKKYLHVATNKKEGGALLDVWYPEISSTKLKTDEEMIYGNALSIHITDARAATTVKYRLEINRKNFLPEKRIQSVYGLKAFIASHEMGHPEYDKLTDRDEYYERLYIFGEGSKELTYIICNGDKAFPNPSCGQVFSDGSLLYQVNYRKHLLPEWKEIESKTKNLLHSFLENKSSTPENEAQQ